MMVFRISQLVLSGRLPRIWATKFRLALCVGACLTVFSAAAQSQEVDYYIAGMERIPVTIVLDKIGIVTDEQAPATAVTSFLSDANLRIADVSDNREPGQIQVIDLAEERRPRDLEMLVRSLTQRNAARDDSVIKYAGLLAKVGDSTAPILLTNEFVAEFAQEVTEEEIAALNDRFKVEIVRRNPFRKQQYVLRIGADSELGFLDASVRYHETQRVKLAHPNFVRPKDTRQAIPNDPMFAGQWHHQNTGQSGGTVDADIDTPLAWEITTGDDDLIIAVIDNGFDVAHPDLVPNLWTNPGEIAGDGIDNDGNTFVDDVNGWDFVGNDNTLAGGAHGTNVAGCVGARGDNGQGVSGSCQRCQLMLLRIPMNAGSEFTDALAFDYARVLGADVITNSWGYPVGPAATPVVLQAIDDAATLGRGGLGAIVLFAMNNPNCNDCINNNACGATPDISSIENVIAVSRATNLERFDNSGFGNCMDVLGPTRSQNGPTFGTLGITTTAPGGGYTNNFGGTSAATPISAGVTGLMLSVNPDLTRLEVQRALQDTTDQIEDSLASYLTTTGFSTPATGQATHGYGRVNAFEAVRLVAPAENGGRAGVDIMLRDNRLDWGNTEQPSNVLFEPTRGFIPHWQSVDIKVDAPPFQPAPTTSQEFDAFADEDPRATETNRVYVRVRNRGPNTCESLTVKLHWAFAGTALPALPGDFWTAFPADSSNTSQWHPLGTVTIRDLPYSGTSIAGSAADAAQIASFDFNAPALDPTQPAFQHYCVFCVIDSPDDPVSAVATGSQVPDFITPRDNNVTHRNLVLQPPSRDRVRTVRFFVRNPHRHRLKSHLTASAPEGWWVKLSDLSFGEDFFMKPHEERLLTLRINPDNEQASGEVRLTQFDLNREEPEVCGGLTIQVSPKSSVNCPPTANWYAWNDTQPPKPLDFHIVGDVTLPNPGAEAFLVMREPQGVNPETLLLDQVTAQRPGNWPALVVTKRVSFTQKQKPYKQVQVFGGDEVIADIKVEDVR